MVRTWGIVAAVALSVAGCEKKSNHRDTVAPKDKPSDGTPAATPVTKAATPAPSPSPASKLAPTAGHSAFDATLTIDGKPGGKKFQGVWLVRADGSKLVIDYRARGLWRPFENQKVHVTGSSYQPRGQAISAAHFRVHTLRMADSQSTASIVELGPEQTLEGSFGSHTVAAGAKAAGQTYTIFKAKGGMTYQVLNPIPAKPGNVKVKARAATRSKFIAHVGGPALWILDTTYQP